MTSQAENSQPQLDKYSKENRWYYTNIDNVDASSRKLLEEYSKIPTEDVDSHIYKMRDLLWSQGPYPCVGQFRFLTLNLSKHPLYQQILSILRQSSHSTSGQPQLLDLGCCVAQELRTLAHAGIPSQNLYGSDLIPSFLSTSYTVFRDQDFFQATLVPADIFSPTLFQDSFAGWEGKFTIIHAGLFLHLFTWEQQLLVCSTVVKLLKSDKFALFVGEMVGRKGGGERGEGSGADLWWKKGDPKSPWLHDEESFGKLWGEVEVRTGTIGMWKVEANFSERKKEKEQEEKDKKGKGIPFFFVGEGMGWLTFSVERI